MPATKGHSMKIKSDPKLSFTEFLNIEGPGRKLIHLKPGGAFFSQGTESNCVFYLTIGRAKLTVVSQAFNSSEKRLARPLLLMAEFGKPGEPETLIPAITQEALAEMIGTTRSRVSFFMNRFRKLGFIEY